MVDRAENPSGIYIHIPFCESKCGYCSFVSYANKEASFSDYLSAIENEIGFYKKHPLIVNTSFDTIFVGGGTPTVLPAKALARVFQTIHRSFSISDDAEITVECNPNTVDKEKLERMKRSGVNRLSIGAQSFNNKVLKTIGRKHQAEDVVNAVKHARISGFENINLDIICGLPGQSIDDFKSDIKEVINLKLEHISIYQLSVDPGTHFEKMAHQGTIDLPSDDMVIDMIDFARHQLDLKGYKRYEISNFSLPGMECRHNLTYWQNRAYLGMGCAAVSYLNGCRIRNSDDPDHYIRKLSSNKPAWVESEALSKKASFREAVIMGLRLIKGIDLESLAERYGIDIHDFYGDTLASLLSRELIIIENHRLRLSTMALPVANQVLSELV